MHLTTFVVVLGAETTATRDVASLLMLVYRIIEAVPRHSQRFHFSYSILTYGAGQVL